MEFGAVCLPIDIFAAALGFLSPCATLQLLRVSRAFRGAGCRALALCRELNLSGSCLLSERGAVSLCDALARGQSGAAGASDGTGGGGGGGAASLLTSLDLSRCSQGVGDEALAAVERALPHLRVLRLTRCKRVSDAGIARVAAGCTELAELDLELCCSLTDQSLTSLAAGQSVGRLSSLNLSGCGISDAGVETLARTGSKSLTHLDLGGCNRLTDRAVRALALLPRLAFLSLNDVHKLTDAGLVALASSAAALRQLELIACVRVTDAGVQALLAGLAGLQRLAVANCLRVTAQAWRGLETQCVIEAA